MDYSISEDLEASESETQKNDEATKWQTKVIKSPNSDSFQLEFTASELSAGECLCISTQEKNGILAMPKLIRAANPPQYKGRLFLYGEEDGILLVNELPLEQYLPTVVASEMPSDYPSCRRSWHRLYAHVRMRITVCSLRGKRMPSMI
ncbi:MAG: SpoIID/LytB domain-containing protein [Lachnospiraceae bacterium]